ncbi:phosphatidylinositol N-acetylglucosaminyltransferase subunit C [Trichophaea hybrida]|nr:phosphatidylinositol N-acetylglucosaminyltransferase subunit C [Trichophaea hybrida]
MPTPVAKNVTNISKTPRQEFSCSDEDRWNYTHRLPVGKHNSPPRKLPTEIKTLKRNQFQPNPKKSSQWKKLLWVKQDYPDNWVDPTFLKDLQRNINVHPYNFYSLVAESTVVVQHLASALIFVTSFVAIYIEVVSPVSVVVISSVLTVAGWAVSDMGLDKREIASERTMPFREETFESVTDAINGGMSSHCSTSTCPVRSFALYSDITMQPYNARSDVSSAGSHQRLSKIPHNIASDKDFTHQHRRSRVIATAKSALLIYFTLLGLSPILRSLTKGVTSDSIWAIATWLFIANFLGFDYGSGFERNFPASFSTNAAITSSVVLASRLTDTSHVFSLLLFSIQVFGLFPVFRRTLKHMSWNLHILLTVVLVVGAAAGLMIVVGRGWAVAWMIGVIAAMGGCGWWMIDLQKYKNEIHGPWDPARPVIRRQWT